MSGLFGSPGNRRARAGVSTDMHGLAHRLRRLRLLLLFALLAGSGSAAVARPACVVERAFASTPVAPVAVTRVAARPSAPPRPQYARLAPAARPHDAGVTPAPRRLYLAHRALLL
jgi:hypothetical protein